MCKFQCRICGGKEYRTLFQWNIPLAADIRECPEDCVKYPIEPVVCRGCGHVQLKEALKTDMYGKYLYTPSFSQKFQEYIISFAEEIDRMANGGEKRVIEIGSSNGFLLEQMKNRGWKVLGFEPSSVLADAAEKRGIYTERMYFGGSDSEKCIKQWGVPDVIILRHVMEHLDDLNGVMELIGTVLKDGLLIIEVPWLLKIVKEKQFYAFFHEHLSYFSITAIRKLLHGYGFEIADVKENDLEGGSIVIYAHRSQNLGHMEARISSYVQQEEEMCSIDQLVDFAGKADGQIHRIRELVETEKSQGKRIAAWGAGQRGITLLNICGLDRTYIDYIIDENRNYWWKYVPGKSAVPIVPPNWLEENFVDVIIILATGYGDEIIAKNSEYLDRGGVFIQILGEDKPYMAPRNPRE